MSLWTLLGWFLSSDARVGCLALMAFQSASFYAKAWTGGTDDDITMCDSPVWSQNQCMILLELSRRMIRYLA